MTPPPADEKTVSVMDQMTRLFLKVIEAGFVLVLLIVLLYILLGADAGPYVGSVIANLQALVTAMSPQALIGVAVVMTLGWIGKRPR